jgi:hypothetical protein
MDEFGTTAGASGGPVPDQLRSLFNHPDDVRVQELPCALPGFGSLAVHFGAGARTVPHQHHNGQRTWCSSKASAPSPMRAAYTSFGPATW